MNAIATYISDTIKAGAAPDFDAIGFGCDLFGPGPLDPLDFVAKLWAQTPELLPTLPGYRTPDFADFKPLAKYVDADPSKHLAAADALGDHRAAISDAISGGAILTGTAAAEIATTMSPALTECLLAAGMASWGGPIAQAGAVAGVLAVKAYDVGSALADLQEGLDEIAARLSEQTATAMAVPLPGMGADVGAATEELQWLASPQLIAPPVAEPAEPPKTEPAATPQPAPSAPAETKPVEIPKEPTPAKQVQTEPLPIAPAGGDSPVDGGAGSAVGAAAVEAAKTQLGTPYVWGGSQPGGFDCSGLTSWAYSQAGYDIPRVAADQTVGTQVSYEQLQPGDLVIWSGHVAMYTGDGMMIEAGDPVQMNPVRTENIGMPFMGFWRPTG